MKRQSDKNWYVYMTNGVMASAFFVLINKDQNMTAVMSMLIFVFGSAIGIPWFYFNKIKKPKRKRDAD